MFKLFNRQESTSEQPLPGMGKNNRSVKTIKNITRAIDGTIASFSEYIVDRVQTAKYDAELRSVQNEVINNERQIMNNRSASSKGSSYQSGTGSDLNQLRQTLVDHREYKQRQLDHFSTDMRQPSELRSPKPKQSNVRTVQQAPPPPTLFKNKRELRQDE